MALPEQIQELFQRSWPILLLGFFIARLLINKYGGNLDSIPGPFFAGFTNLWRVLNTLLSDPTETQIQLHRSLHSNFVRIGPRVVSISDPKLIPTIYGIKSEFTKTSFYSIAELWYEGKCTPSLFECRDEAYHAQIRKPLVNAYRMATMIDFEPAVNSTTELFMSKMDHLVVSGKPVKLEVWLHRYAFDVIGEILFSKKLGFLESGTDVESIMAGIRSFTQYLSVVGQIPIVDHFLLKNPLMLRYGPANPIVTFTLNRMKERAAWKASQGQTKRDFLERCLEAQAKYPEVVTDRMVMLYNFDNIAAGSDTTALILTSLFYYLLKNPATLEKAVEELDCADKEGRLSEYVTWREASKLSYMQACIKEATRMHPPIGLILERYVPKGGIALSGHYFPEGTIVGVNAWVTARNKEVYGEDCNCFRPERWLEASEEELAAMERGNLAFGHGKRGCLGKSIALLEVSKLVPQLLRHYEFSFARPDLEWKLQGGWMVRQEGVEVVVSKRT
ncbi:uncharacterized protein A1O5_12891 [Cladophialophora psammophila CBS 110553]|uniref:Cytochrome P450 oxidoreductase n=1 Tax=Cladophialophora psammophila CBS 110553 TaxID=1182543 RepID=W9VPP7_9EURO|nr:uncharacterized protein A1O5_12891 [Cladophialophora psammophila CBS 110553]EXJ54980.1 hypothetical protein A1O5_12891 [Cladophialophora psammophila CBS 110553]